MTADRFAELAAAATPGPWILQSFGSIGPDPELPEWYIVAANGECIEAHDSYPGHGHDVAFIAACGSHRERIVTALRLLEREEARAAALVRDAELSEAGLCVICGKSMNGLPFRYHDYDCRAENRG